jgi:hypothetical protein
MMKEQKASAGLFWKNVLCFLSQVVSSINFLLDNRTFVLYTASHAEEKDHSNFADLNIKRIKICEV